ncbi:hypothetical protein MTO96_001895 [Rhipicephalus appendiculatus]
MDVAAAVCCLSHLWSAEACPQRCNCLELQVLCQEAGYRELPAPVPRAAVALLLTSNQLERLATDSFRGLVRLRKLILDNNRIQALAPFTFRGLAGLDELSLQNNPLTVLSQQSLSGLSRVRMLQLGFNRIARVEPFAFAGSSDLGSISLEGNPLELLRSRAFANLSRVGSIRLPRSLAAMEPDAFAGLRNVSLVSIEAPRLKRLPQFAFRGLEHAGELLIRDAEIGLIDSGAFAGLSHARRVTLEGCTVEAVRAAAFAGMRAVGQLRIGGNRLGSVLPGALDALDQASVSPRASFGQLASLRLSAPLGSRVPAGGEASARRPRTCSTRRPPRCRWTLCRVACPSTSCPTRGPTPLRSRDVSRPAAPLRKVSSLHTCPPRWQPLLLLRRRILVAAPRLRNFVPPAVFPLTACVVISFPRVHTQSALSASVESPIGTTVLVGAVLL